MKKISLPIDISTPAFYEYPINIFNGNSFKNYIFPLWNPYQGCGRPHLAQYSTRVLFPYQILFNITPYYLHDILYLFRLVFAGIFIFSFLRLKKYNFYSAIIASIAVIFSGCFTWFINLEQFINAGMMIPAGLYFAYLVVYKPTVTNHIFFIFVNALILLSGQPEVALYILMLIYIYIFFEYFNNNKNRFKLIFFLIVDFLVALIIASPQIFPFIYLAKYGYHLHPSDSNMGFVAPTSLYDLISIILPNFSLDYKYIPTIPFKGIWDVCGSSLGITGLLGIFASVIFEKNKNIRSFNLFMIFCGVFILLKNLGIPPFEWIGYLPLLRRVWTPRWAGSVWGICLSLPAGRGIYLIIKDYNKIIFINFFNSIKQIQSKIKYNKIRLLLAGSICILIRLFNYKLNIFVQLNNITKEFIKHSVATANYNKLLNCFIYNNSLPIYLILISVILLILYLRKRYSMPYKNYDIYIFISIFIFSFITEFKFALPKIFVILMQFGTIYYVYYISNKLNNYYDILILGFLSSTLILYNKFFVYFNFYSLLSLLFGIVVLYSLYNILIKYNEPQKLIFIFIIELWFNLPLNLNPIIFLIKFLIASFLILFIASNKLSHFNKLHFKFNLTQKIAVLSILIFIFSMLLTKGLPIKKNMFDKNTNSYKYLKNNINNSRIFAADRIFIPNSASAFKLQDIRYIDALTLEEYNRFEQNFITRHNRNKFNTLWFTGENPLKFDKTNHFEDSENEPDPIKYLAKSTGNIFSFLGVKYILFNKDFNEKFINNFNLNSFLSKVYDREVKIYENKKVNKRVFFPKKVVFYDSKNDLYTKIKRYQNSLNNVLLLDKKYKFISNNFDNLRGKASAEITKYDLNNISINIFSEFPRFLVLSDNYYSGWNAYIDNIKTNIYKCYGFLRCVMIPAGEHKLEFKYEPVLFYAGAYISFFTNTVLLLYLFINSSVNFIRKLY